MIRYLRGMKIPAFLLAVGLLPLAACAHQESSTSVAPAPSPAATPSHDAQVDARGDQAMGFQHMKTAHHFVITATGGEIEAEANDAADTQSRDMIRMHMHHIAKAFADGDFDMPMFIHGQVPPGVPEMKKLASEIHYTAEETEKGAKVVIATQNAEALAAIHEFLEFQIQEHRTGDPVPKGS